MEDLLTAEDPERAEEEKETDFQQKNQHCQPQRSNNRTSVSAAFNKPKFLSSGFNNQQYTEFYLVNVLVHCSSCTAYTSFSKTRIAAL